MKTSVSDGLPYIDFCNKVMENPELLKDFRRCPDYDLVVPGNRKGEEVLEFVELLKREYSLLLPLMPLFEKQQGVFGNPTTHKFDFGVGVYELDVPLPLHIFYLALTCLYFKFDCYAKYGKHSPEMKICEIGPGAGLFFKIFTDLYPSTKYTFVDLEGPLFINKKHVEYLGRESNVEEYLPCDKIMSDDLLERKYDLVISDCAFNELHASTQKKYIEKILNHSDRGRIAFYNAPLVVEGEPVLSILEVFNLLEKKTKIIKMDLRVPTLYWDETERG